MLRDEQNDRLTRSRSARRWDGKHRYSAEQFGLTKDHIRADLADYIRHFAIRAED